MPLHPTPIRAWLLLSSVGLLAAEAHAQQAWAWKLRAGETWDYTRSRKQTAILGDGPARVSSSKETGTWHVDRVEPDGSTRITQVLARVRGTGPSVDPEGAVVVIDYDTDLPDAGPNVATPPDLEHHRRRVKAGGFSFTLTPRGEVRDVTPSDEMRRAIADGRRIFGDAALRFSIPPTLVPRSPGKAGETWTEPPAGTDPDIAATPLATKYRHAGTVARDGLNLEEVAWEIETDQKRARPTPYPIRIMALKIEGKTLFDPAAGHLVEHRREIGLIEVRLLNGREVECKTSRVEAATLTRAGAPGPR